MQSSIISDVCLSYVQHYYVACEIIEYKRILKCLHLKFTFKAITNVQPVFKVMEE